MSSAWGKSIEISIFGESHGEGIGVVLNGLPAGEPVDIDAIALQMSRRAPGQDKSATPRKESDTPEILSGVFDGHTTGAPLCAVIRNTNTRSGDYSSLKRLPRPGHSDYAASVRYKGYNDIRGGGHFSGRLTAPLVFAGAVCRQILSRRGVHIGGHVYAVGSVQDTPFDPVHVTDEELDVLASKYFPTISEEALQAMKQEIETARMNLDSVGGIVECAVTGLPAGLGSPMFGGVENVLSSILFGIPAVKGLEFGAGFAAAKMHGSENNDPYFYNGDRVETETNNHGGILGGITTGMPVVLRAAFKPTPSIAQEQRTVDLTARENAHLAIEGRHDPCIVPRAVPAVEAAVAVGILNLMADGGLL